MEEVKALLRQVIKNQNDLLGLKDVELSPKWEGGKVLIYPGNESMKAYELPLDNLFKKIISIREKLRVLEQKINNHPALSGPEKLELEQYITRCYGSLTTFNMLFRQEEDKIKGSAT